jgi:PadR family transcriptional regulator PadR
LIPHNSMYICSMYSKELLKGTLSVIILNLLAENGRMYGYEIFQRVKKLSDGKILLKDGSLYPALQKMSKEGLLTYKEEYIGKRVRKYYLLTPKGKSEKILYLEELKDFMATLNKIISPQFKSI